jgi:hypothetical protein
MNSIGVELNEQYSLQLAVLLVFLGQSSPSSKPSSHVHRSQTLSLAQLVGHGAAEAHVWLAIDGAGAGAEAVAIAE